MARVLAQAQKRAFPFPSSASSVCWGCCPCGQVPSSLHFPTLLSQLLLCLRIRARHQWLSDVPPLVDHQR